jgi:hypothetical protein
LVEVKNSEDILKEIIRNKIYDPTTELKYNGFDMSGYGDAHFKNLELISKFKQYMMRLDIKSNDDWRVPYFIIPMFWKGGGQIIRINYDETLEENIDRIVDDDIGGYTTEEIIFKVITSQNPDILIDLGDEEDKKEYFEFKKDLDLKQLIDEDSRYNSTKLINSFKRNLKIVKELKQKHKFCQICSFSFKKKDGSDYNEIHHIIPLSKNGKDKKINSLVLCANCHRQLHYADVDISKVLENKIKINNEWKDINETN